MMELLGRYNNGNYRTTLLSDGTRIRETKEDDFVPAFAENIDIKICNRCDMNCSFCHEGSTVNGGFGDIMNEKFVETLHPYQEVALGGGNVLEHPDLIPFLEKIRDKKVIANITLHQRHFEKNMEFVDMLVRKQLIYGLGISVVSPTDAFIEKVKRYPNAVIHVIHGVLAPSDAKAMYGKGLKLLILGYKHLRRGEDWYHACREHICMQQEWLKEHLEELFEHFEVVSFDNLAIKQLEVRKLLTREEWDVFYAGNDSAFTFYIDMVERKFAKNSTAPLEQRYDLMDSVDEMFEKVRLKKP
jgi:hypothetical protein